MEMGTKARRSTWELCTQGFIEGNDDVDQSTSITQQRDPTYMWFKPMLVRTQQQYEFLFLEQIT